MQEGGRLLRELACRWATAFNRAVVQDNYNNCQCCSAGRRQQANLADSMVVLSTTVHRTLQGGRESQLEVYVLTQAAGRT